MPTDLGLHVEQTVMVDTHEHTGTEREWVDHGPGDVLAALFGNYARNDLISAGASPAAVEKLSDAKGDLEARWAGVREAWQRFQFTGYGQGVRLIAERLFGIDEMNPRNFRAAQGRLDAFRQPGQRLSLLRDKAKLDHVQVDDFRWRCEPDESGPEFFLYDIGWAAFSWGNLKKQELEQETDIAVVGVATLQEAMRKLFDKYACYAIAMKAQHAYVRTLRWRERRDGEAQQALAAILRDPDHPDPADQLCLGDWCLARGVELAIEHNLPIKLHTGYYAGNGYMVMDRIRAAHLAPLLQRYPKARFVLMHISYPYDEELIALTKHYPNVWADMCWAWSINPRSSGEFLRRYLHASPINKLFVFGGDAKWPTDSYAYSIQARDGLRRVLEAEVAEGQLSEAEASAVATRLMRGNQYECFDIEGRRAAIRDSKRSAQSEVSVG